LFGSSAFAFVLNFLKSKAPNRAFLFGIFRVLHTVQSSIFKVRVVAWCSAATHLLYHIVSALSTTFLFFCFFFFSKKRLPYFLRRS
jgi:hypothetical protein